MRLTNTVPEGGLKIHPTFEWINTNKNGFSPKQTIFIYFMKLTL